MNTNTVIQGDCIEEMKDMDENSVDAVVTDPPYGLAFMGKDWDDFEPKEFQEFCEEWGEEALRVLKPGGHLLAFCGTRTYHRMVVGLEDAGFEIRDQIAWMYGSGFPKGQDISKAVDKELGKEEDRKVVDKDVESSGWKAQDKKNAEQGYRPNQYYDDEPDVIERTKAATDKAEKWDGWNTSLKPGHEPIVVAQKPKEGTYAENVLEYGVGGLNIDACRIGTEKRKNSPAGSPSLPGDNRTEAGKGMFNGVGTDKPTTVEGRWPANVVLDPKSAEMLDKQSGISESNVRQPKNKKYEGMAKYDSEKSNFSFQDSTVRGHNDSGGASRFFYSAKARKSERNAGLEELENVKYGAMKGHKDKSMKTGSGNERNNQTKNDIATLKPINLMRWLVRLVTPEDGTVLDPFAGSGTTGCACEVEGFNYVLIEKRERFAEKIAPLRLDYWSKPENWSDLKDHKELPTVKSLQNGSLTDF